MNPQIDKFLSKAKQWRKEMEELRRICLACGLAEELKWGKPCYTFQGGNVAILQGFKESCALMFFKGALLKDPKGIMERPGESSQAAKRMKFTSVGEIQKLEATLKTYIREAVAVEKAGLEVEFKKNPEPVPVELQKKLDANAEFRKALYGLTPGRQRAYLLHFNGAKQSKTREARVEKCLPQILEGRGLND